MEEATVVVDGERRMHDGPLTHEIPDDPSNALLLLLATAMADDADLGVPKADCG